MSDLVERLRKRAPDNARRVIEICAADLPEYAAAAADPREYRDMLDFAVNIRLRTLELVAANEPLTVDDLDMVAALGERRGETGMSRAAVRRVLTLHATTTLDEIQEVSDPGDLEATMRLLAWLGPAGAVAQDAYLQGYLRGQRRYLPVVARVRQFVDAVVAAEAAAVSAGARDLDIRLPDRYLVIVARASAPLTEPAERGLAQLRRPAGRGERGLAQLRRPAGRGEIVHALWNRHGVAATWRDPDELVLLVPDDQPARAMDVLRDVVEPAVGPCSVGAATGPPVALAEAFALARQISRVTRPAPGHLYTLQDVFLELGAATLPEVDRWLRDLAGRLAGGPDLLDTLDAYYRNDLNRSRAAASLHIHARSLDYRLRRVRELTGIDPGSVHGVRVLSTVVSLAIAGR